MTSLYAGEFDKMAIRIVSGKDTTAMAESRVSTFRRPAPAIMALAFVLAAVATAGDKVEVPVINGMAGSCSANFTVTDSAKNPIYNAKIEVTLRYGFVGMRKSELQIGTNSDGKARVTGLPEKVKKPLEFRVSSGDLSKTVQVNPTEKCDSSVEVVLGPE
jgi:hypothetical protein